MQAAAHLLAGFERPQRHPEVLAVTNNSKEGFCISSKQEHGMLVAPTTGASAARAAEAVWPAS
jgi:hypothetical protein